MLYGITRKYHGIREYRYIYEGKKLLELENSFHPSCEPVAEADLDGLDSCFWANDTYVVCKLETEEDLVRFLCIPTEGICDQEDPSLRMLADTISEYKTECMYTGETDPAAVRLLRNHPGYETRLHDPRYQELISSGMPEEAFDLDWPDGSGQNSREFCYRSVMEALATGTYEDLRNRVIAAGGENDGNQRNY